MVGWERAHRLDLSEVADARIGCDKILLAMFCPTSSEIHSVCPTRRLLGHHRTSGRYQTRCIRYPLLQGHTSLGCYKGRPGQAAVLCLREPKRSRAQAASVLHVFSVTAGGCVSGATDQFHRVGRCRQSSLSVGNIQLFHRDVASQDFFGIIWAVGRLRIDLPLSFKDLPVFQKQTVIVEVCGFRCLATDMANEAVLSDSHSIPGLADA